MSKALSEITHFVPTLRMEMIAFAETKTRHDRERALKAIAYMEAMAVELRKEVMTIQLAKEDGDE